MNYAMILIESWDDRTRRGIVMDALAALAGLVTPDGVRVHGGELDSGTGEEYGEMDTTIVVGMLPGVTFHDCHQTLRDALRGARPKTTATLPAGMENADHAALWDWYYSGE